MGYLYSAVTNTFVFSFGRNACYYGKHISASLKEKFSF
jgi:hypothetical protein